MQCRRPWFNSWVGKIHYRRYRLSTSVFLGFSVAKLLKNSSAMWETWVPSLGWEDPLKKGTATHSSILAWRIPQSMGLQRVRHDWVTFTFNFQHIITDLLFASFSVTLKEMLCSLTIMVEYLFLLQMYKFLTSCILLLFIFK